jgi:DNA repair exonuclease SbcCD ATPase subunit
MVKKKGRTSGPVMSLFAFQDIITATIGIIVLFILALALLIAEEAPPDVVELTETTTDILNDQLHKVQQQVSALKLELERAEVFSQETTMTEEEFKARLRFVTNTKEAVENEQAAIEAQVEKLTDAKNELLEDDEEFQRTLAEIQQAVEALSDQEQSLRTSDFSARLQNKLAELKREIEALQSNKHNPKDKLAELQREIEALQSKLNSPKEVDVKIVEYDFDNTELKTVWIAHIREDWCQLFAYGSSNSTTPYEGSEAEVANWLQKEIKNKYEKWPKRFYVYIAIAPSGVAIFNEVHLKLMENDDLAYGFDLLPNDEVELK